MEAQTQGEIRKDVDLSVLALLMVGADVFMFQIQSLLRHMPEVKFTDDHQYYAQMVADILSRGIAGGWIKNEKTDTCFDCELGSYRRLRAQNGRIFLGPKTSSCPTENRSMAITTANVTAEDVPIILETVGEVQSKSVPTVDAEISGRIIQLLVDVGDAVKKGQVIARLD